MAHHFIGDDTYEDDTIRDFHDFSNETRTAITSPIREAVSYKLGEVIANGVRFFGQTHIDKKTRNRTAMCICPQCGELWRVVVSNVKNGNSKSCGCRA